MSAHPHNKHAWDRRAQAGLRFTKPATPEDLKDPLKLVDPLGWLGGDIQGQRLLCLAAGGGKHSMIYAAAGAHVTVVDISPAMLELDRKMSASLGLPVQIVEASMDDLSALTDASFDIVIHPVSTCYVPDLAPVYAEAARVLKQGGLYISQHKQPVSMQADIAPVFDGRAYPIVEPYLRQGPLPEVRGSLHREEGTLEYVHNWSRLVGQMCRAGLVIEDLTEPKHGDPKAAPGTFGHRSLYIPPYVRIKARRANIEQPKKPATLWTP